MRLLLFIPGSHPWRTRSVHTQSVLKTQRTLILLPVLFPVNVLSSFVLYNVSFFICLFMLHIEVQCLHFRMGMLKVLK